MSCSRGIQGTSCLIWRLTASKLSSILRSKYHKESYTWVTQCCFSLLLSLMALLSPKAAGLPFFAWVLGAWLLAAGVGMELGDGILDLNKDMQLGPCQLYLPQDTGWARAWEFEGYCSYPLFFLPLLLKVLSSLCFFLRTLAIRWGPLVHCCVFSFFHNGSRLYIYHYKPAAGERIYFINGKHVFTKRKALMFSLLR